MREMAPCWITRSCALRNPCGPARRSGVCVCPVLRFLKRGVFDFHSIRHFYLRNRSELRRQTKSPALEKRQGRGTRYALQISLFLENRRPQERQRGSSVSAFSR